MSYRLQLAFVALIFLAVRPALALDDGFHWESDPDQGEATLSMGDQPVLRYMYAYDPSTEERLHETYKVFHHVYGPGTNTLITKGPGGRYTHHRGMFIGWNKGSEGERKFDFWHCKNGVHLRHIRFIEMKDGADQGSMSAEIHWNDGDGQPVVREIRSVTASRKGETGWQLDWQMSLTSVRGSVELSGDRQHAGFQFRAAQVVADENSARYIRPSGFPEEAEAFQVSDRTDPDAHVNLGWLAMTFPLDKETYTIEYFEDPSLPKPSRYSERPYGRFGAFFEQRLEEGKPFTMNYRVNVIRGEVPTREAIQADYDLFAKKLNRKQSGRKKK